MIVARSTNWMPQPDSAGFHHRSLWSGEKAVPRTDWARQHATSIVATHARRMARIGISPEDDPTHSALTPCARPDRPHYAAPVSMSRLAPNPLLRRRGEVAGRMRGGRGALLEPHAGHPYQAVGNRLQALELVRVRPQPVPVEQVDDRPVLEHD